MERVMTVEEKIRRAEEIYQRRKQGEVRPVAKVTVNNKKDIKLLKKMMIQIVICMIIYLIFYMVQKQEYVFSKDFINKSNELLSYDTNFIILYEKMRDQIMGVTKQEQSEPPIQEQSNEEAIGGAEEEIEVKEENLSQEQIDIQNIKNTTSFIKPVEGTISSKYGQRDNANGSIPKNHTGTDIASMLGSKIIASTDGEVVLASEEGDYRKTFEDSNGRS